MSPSEIDHAKLRKTHRRVRKSRRIKRTIAGRQRDGYPHGRPPKVARAVVRAEYIEQRGEASSKRSDADVRRAVAEKLRVSYSKVYADTRDIRRPKP